MRAIISAVLLAALATALPPSHASAASEIEALRDDLRRTQEDLRKLLELQQQTQRRMEELQKKLEAIEAAAKAQGAPPAPGAAPPTAAAAPPPPPTAQAPAPTAPAQPTGLAGLLGGRAPFTVAGRPLLFDISAAADFVGSLSSAKDSLNGRIPTFIARGNRIFPREVELAVNGIVDPYVRGDIFFSFGESGNVTGGAATRSLEANVEEAYLTTLALPHALQVRGGRMRPQFGLLNTLHAHDLPQVDRPNVLRNFLGEEELVENGIEASWVAPLPVYLELRGGVFSGDNDRSFGAGNIRNPLGIARIKTFFELGDEHALQLGLSGATGPNTDGTPHGTRTWLGGFDFKYKWKPLDVPYRQFILAGEYLFSHQRRETPVDAVDPATGTIICSLCNRDERHANRHGAYIFGDYQLDRRWFVGTRLDWSQYPLRSVLGTPENRPGAREWGLAPYLTFQVSEFFRLRAEYKRTFRNFGPNADEVFLQGTFILGPHPAHPF